MEPDREVVISYTTPKDAAHSPQAYLEGNGWGPEIFKAGATHSGRYRDPGIAAVRPLGIRAGRIKRAQQRL